MHYLKSSCIYDLLAILPFNTMFTTYNNLEMTKATLRRFRLFKLLRLPRLFELINVDRFKKFIKDYYNHKLSESVKNNTNGDNYPILKSLMIVKAYQVARLALIILTASFFLGIIWHIIVVDLLT